MQVYVATTITAKSGLFPHVLPNSTICSLLLVYSVQSLPTSKTGVSTLDDLVCMNGGFLMIFIVYSMNSWLCNNEYIIHLEM